MNDELAGPVGWARVGLGGLSMTSVAEIISDLENLEEAELRRSLFSVATEAPDPGQPYPHQIEALRRIELGANRVPPVSGILHYPTGAGKTRVGVELIARALRADPRHRFVWATHTKNLIRQSMVRLVEASKLFPPDTTFTWAENPDELEDSEDDVHVVFLTRTALTKVLGRAGDRRCRHPWRLRLERGDQNKPPAASSSKSFACRMYVRATRSERCSVCRMIASSDLPRLAAVVANPGCRSSSRDSDRPYSRRRAPGLSRAAAREATPFPRAGGWRASTTLQRQVDSLTEHATMAHRPPWHRISEPSTTQHQACESCDLRTLGISSSSTISTPSSRTRNTRA